MSSIFICHSSVDKPFVRELKWSLERYDVQVWVDEDELKAGSSLVNTLSSAISEMQYLGIVLSPNAVKSNWVQQELELALTEQIESAGVKVIPLMLRDCEVPNFLKGKKYVNFVEWNRSRKPKKKQELLKKCVKEIIHAMDIDDRDDQRWSGQQMILVGDLRKKLVEFFAPLETNVEFYDDDSGLNFIRVKNGDGTFQLYDYWSKPTYIDLLNDVFPGDEPIIEIQIIDETILWTHEERDIAVKNICVDLGIEKEKFWDHGDHSTSRLNAYHAYERWLFENNPISLIREGDFGSRRR